MKRIYKLLAPLLAAALLSSCAPQTPGVQNKEPETSGITAKTTKAPSVNVMGQVIYDELHYKTEKNAELVVFRCGDDFYTDPWDADDPLNWWLRVEGTVPADLEAMPDGSFGVLKADITRLSGGIAGYCGQPEIKKVKSFSAVTVDEAVAKCGLTSYSTGETAYNEPQLCTVGDNTFIVMKSYGIRVYLDGQLFGVFDTVYEAEAAMGLHGIPDSNVQFEEQHSLPLYVFRCGDFYFAYCQYNVSKGCWGYLLNREMQNKGMGFTLEDGEAGVIDHTDFMVVNGGEESYINAIMLTEDKEPEIIRLGTLTLNLSPGHWEDDPQKVMYEMRDYKAGDTVIFLSGGKYHVYSDHGGERTLIGVYEHSDEVDEALGWDRENRAYY
jgi:hypothetical protein